MDESSLISNLHIILSNNQFNTQFIYFCCGLYNNITLYTDFQIKGIYYIIGKLLSNCKQDIIYYVNYLIIIINERDSILKLQDDINIIDNLHFILNSPNRNNFIMFLCGIYSQEEWGEAEKNGDSYIIGRVLDISENKIFTFCKFMILNNNNNTDENIVFEDRGDN